MIDRSWRVMEALKKAWWPLWTFAFQPFSTYRGPGNSAKWFFALLVAGDMVLTTMIILKVPYTEIDWKAYMQEVEGVVQGQYDYTHLRGDTGPLVYPAGFVYVYYGLYALTQSGVDIITAQYAFLWIYILTLIMVLIIYGRSGNTPPIAIVILILSKRIHSIFVLRLFNDCIAMSLLYGSVILFQRNAWLRGCAIYSLAVSIKMNVLLFAPGLLLLLIQSQKSILRTCACLAVCGSIQLVLAAPFLYTNWRSYLKGAFDLGRVFMFKWTVNWKFLSEDVFTGKPLAVLLLAFTVAVNLWFFAVKWPAAFSRNRRKVFERIEGGRSSQRLSERLSPRYITATLFTSNFVGIVFARTLHYQFYSWYFHQLPFLLWMTKLPNLMRFALMAAMEIAFNVYPAQAWSSLLLQGSHWIILVSLAFADVPEPYAKEEPNAPSAASLGAAGERPCHGNGAAASATPSSTSDVALAAKKTK